MLSQYCGLRDTSFTISYQSDTPSTLLSRQDHNQALLGTAEYQLLGKQVEAANLQKKLAVGQNLPSVAVGAGYNYHNLLDNNHTFGMVFVTVSVPISDWWGGSHTIKRRKIEHQQAQEQLADNAELLKIRMQNAWNGVEESYQLLQLAKRSIEQAEENLRLNRNYYRAGTSKMSDLLEAQMLYQQSCDKYTDASPYNYYANSKGSLMIHPETGAELEKMLLVLRDEGEDAAFAYVRKRLREDKDARRKKR